MERFKSLSECTFYLHVSLSAFLILLLVLLPALSLANPFPAFPTLRCSIFGFCHRSQLLAFPPAHLYIPGLGGSHLPLRLCWPPNFPWAPAPPSPPAPPPPSRRPGSSSSTHRPASSSSSSGEPKQKKPLPRCSPTTSPERGSRGGGEDTPPARCSRPDDSAHLPALPGGKKISGPYGDRTLNRGFISTRL